MPRKQPKLAISVIFVMALIPSCAFEYARVEPEVPSLNQEGEGVQNALIITFIKANYYTLRSEMAVGQGRSLANLANLLNIKEAEKQQFYALTKNRFNQLFVSPETTAEELIANLRAEMLEQQ